MIASQSQEKIKNMELVENFDSRPHKAVTFLVAEKKKSRRELRMPEALPGFSGGNC